MKCYMPNFFFRHALVLILGLVMMFFLPVSALAATLSLSPSSGTFNRGCTFSLDIVVDTQGAQTDGTDAILIYDPSRFSISSSSIVPNLNVYPDFPGNNVDEATGRITISGLASVATAFTGKGTLSTLQFSVKDAAPTGATQISFDFDPNDPDETTDSNVVERTTIVDLLNSVTNGSYIVGTGACGASTISPTPSPSVFRTVPPPTPQGDTNISTPSADDEIPIKKLPDGGTIELTFALTIVGGVLTVLGILGLAFL